MIVNTAITSRQFTYWTRIVELIWGIWGMSPENFRKLTVKRVEFAAK